MGISEWIDDTEGLTEVRGNWALGCKIREGAKRNENRIEASRKSQANICGWNTGIVLGDGVKWEEARNHEVVPNNGMESDDVF